MAAQAGYDGIELCGFPPHVSIDSLRTAEERRHLRDSWQRHGLELSGYAADLSQVNPAAEQSRDAYLDLFRRHIDLLADLGGPAIRVDTVAAPGSIPELERPAAMERIAETWREAAAIAQNASIRVVWEFEPGFAFHKPSDVGALYEKVAHPNFFILFDTGHAHMCSHVGARQEGDPEILPGGAAEFLDQCAGRIGALHFTDSDGTLYCDETSAHVPFGQGQIDFRALKPKLKAIRGVDWWTVDLAFSAETKTQLAPSLSFLRKLAS